MDNQAMLKRLVTAKGTFNQKQLETEEEERKAMVKRLSQNAYRYRRTGTGASGVNVATYLRSGEAGLSPLADAELQAELQRYELG